MKQTAAILLSLALAVLAGPATTALAQPRTFYCDPGPSGDTANHDGLSREAPWGTLASVFTARKIKQRQTVGANFLNPSAPCEPGDTIVLLDGYHGNMSAVNVNYVVGYINTEGMLTIQADAGATPVVGGRWLAKGYVNWKFDGITFDYHANGLWPAPLATPDNSGTYYYSSIAVFQMDAGVSPFAANDNITFENCTFRGCDDATFNAFVRTDEIQTITTDAQATAGTFTLTLNGKTTATIAYNATLSQIEAAVHAKGAEPSYWGTSFFHITCEGLDADGAGATLQPLSSNPPKAFTVSAQTYGDMPMTTIDVSGLTGPTQGGTTVVETVHGVSDFRTSLSKMVACQIASCGNSVVRGCTFTNAPYGLNAGGTNLLVEDNTVTNFSANGTSVMSGKNQIWQDNEIYNCIRYVELHPDLMQMQRFVDGENLIVRRNKMMSWKYGFAHPWRSGSQGIFIEGPEHTDALTTTNKGIQIYNNLVICTHSIGITFKWAAANVKIYHNTLSRVPVPGIYTNAPAILFQSGSAAGHASLPCYVQNNIAWNLPPTTYAWLMCANNLDIEALDPTTVFTDVTTDDFSVPSTSPAVDVGVTLVGADYQADILGVARDSSPDAGAYEYIPDPPAEGPGEVTGLSPANNTPNLNPNPTLSWNPAQRATSYEVYWWVTGDSVPAEPLATVYTNSCTPTGQTNATSYSWKVVAINAVDTSESATYAYTTTDVSQYYLLIQAGS